MRHLMAGGVFVAVDGDHLDAEPLQRMITSLPSSPAPSSMTRLADGGKRGADPALVLWSLGRESSTLAAFESCSHYAINVLAADQVDFSQRFSQSNRDDLANIDISIGTGGAPILPGCCAWFECRNEMRYPGGDHLIFVGLVEGFHRQDKLPLVFHRGRYRELA
jgi:flavin reductase (DIM6/NTAB) family NADH-FMN oxidoreductase RutF